MNSNHTRRNTYIVWFRIGELFDIIVDYPDSLPAVRDLRAALLLTDLLPFLISSLTNAYVPPFPPSSLTNI